MIESIKEPVWDSTTREWVISYMVKDEDAGFYEQTVRCEALISAENHLKLIKTQLKQRSK